MKKSAFFLFTLVVILTSGCKKDEEETPAPTNPGNNNTGAITISSPWQYSIKVDGTTYANVDGVANFQGAFSWGGSIVPAPDSSYTTFGSGLSDLNSINKSFGIDIGSLGYINGDEIDTARFKAFIHTGAYPYRPGIGVINGVVIGWVDANGDIWSTDSGTGDQTGSAFTITDIQYLGLVFFNYEIKFKATFNCKLYNIMGTQTRTLTDGVFVGILENYN